MSRLLDEPNSRYVISDNGEDVKCRSHWLQTYTTWRLTGRRHQRLRHASRRLSGRRRRRWLIDCWHIIATLSASVHSTNTFSKRSTPTSPSPTSYHRVCCCSLCTITAVISFPVFHAVSLWVELARYFWVQSGTDPEVVVADDEGLNTFS